MPSALGQSRLQKLPVSAASAGPGRTKAHFCLRFDWWKAAFGMSKRRKRVKDDILVGDHWYWKLPIRQRRVQENGKPSFVILYLFVFAFFVYSRGIVQADTVSVLSCPVGKEGAMTLREPFWRL